jgi:galactokinase
MTESEITEQFQREFGVMPQVFSAPARVNLIGEHTDYNEGFVLPSAIGFYTRVAIAPRPDKKLSLRSQSFERRFDFDITNLPSQKIGAWCDYVLGVALQLKLSGIDLAGANLLIASDVPVGAGLSSSAALEVASALALLAGARSEIALPKLPQLCRRAENEYVGARVGIMDQFVSCFGRAGHALLLDCRSLKYELAPISENVRLVVCNTRVKHELSAGEYNRRREECEQAVQFLAQIYPAARSLRDISAAQLSAAAKTMPPVLFKRARHVVNENERVLRAADAFRAGDLHRAGELMRQSHHSLRDDFEVSCRELDAMVNAAEGLAGYYGGRMTGGGFGGSTVNLVEEKHAEDFARQIAERYREKISITPDVFICSPADGAVAGR